MGTVVGAVASGRVPVGNAEGDPVSSWLNPVSVMVGVLFVATCAYLSAVFLVSDARRAGSERPGALLHDTRARRRSRHGSTGRGRHRRAPRRRALPVRRPDARGTAARDPVRPVRARGDRAAPPRCPSRRPPTRRGRGGVRGLGLGRGAIPVPASAEAHDRRRSRHERDAHRGPDRLRRRGRPRAAVDRAALHAHPAERDRGNGGPAGGR